MKGAGLAACSCDPDGAAHSHCSSTGLELRVAAGGCCLSAYLCEACWTERGPGASEGRGGLLGPATGPAAPTQHSICSQTTRGSISGCLLLTGSHWIETGDWMEVRTDEVAQQDDSYEKALLQTFCEKLGHETEAYYEWCFIYQSIATATASQPALASTPRVQCMKSQSCAIQSTGA